MANDGMDLTEGTVVATYQPSSLYWFATTVIDATAVAYKHPLAQHNILCCASGFYCHRHQSAPVVQSYQVPSEFEALRAAAAQAEGEARQADADDIDAHSDNPSVALPVVRNLALASGRAMPYNPFEWEVYSANVSGVPNAALPFVSKFGRPTQETIKRYQELGARVAFDIETNRGQLQQTTIDDLELAFAAQNPLHFETNPFLRDLWLTEMQSYRGGMTGKALYAVIRSKMTKLLAQIAVHDGTLNELLKGVSGRPFEIHHIIYKSICDEWAAEVFNLVLTQRSRREKDDGPGQHELMHQLSSGMDSNKFSVLVPPFIKAYVNWLTKNKVAVTKHPSIASAMR